MAGKTGTSRDGWFVGYTPNLVCAVWVGFDDNKQLGLTGAEAALPAWAEFVSGAVDARPELGGEQFARPAGVTTVEVDAETGLLASTGCPQREIVATTEALAPRFHCYTHDPALSLIASADEPGGGTSSLTTPATPYPQDSVVSGAASDSATAPRPSLPRAVTGPAPLEPAPASTWRSTTRVVTDAGGRRALVNDMRGVYSRKP